MITGTNLDIAKDPKTVQFSWRGGDVCLLSPRGSMLKAPWTKIFWQHKFKWSVIPFVSIRFWPGSKWGMYFGGKGVGWDETYSAWHPGPREDFSIITFRFFTDGD